MKTGLKPLGIERFWVFLLLLPTFIGLIFGAFGSVFFTVIISFTQWDLLTPPKWVWFNNFINLFTDDLFGTSFITTLKFAALYVPGVLSTSLVAALLLNRKLRGIGFFRTIYFLPVVSSAVAVGLVWSWLYARNDGLFNLIIESLGGQPLNWLGTKMVLYSVVLVNIWGAVGEGMIVFLAGLQAVPRDYYEAAQVDGADSRHQFWHITVPLISPSIFFQSILSTIHAFQAFEYVYILTRRAGGGSSMPVMMFSIYRNGFNYFKMGEASAQALALAVMIFAMTLFYFWLQRRWVVYQ